MANILISKANLLWKLNGVTYIWKPWNALVFLCTKMVLFKGTGIVGMLKTASTDRNKKIRPHHPHPSAFKTFPHSILLTGTVARVSAKRNKSVPTFLSALIQEELLRFERF